MSDLKSADEIIEEYSKPYSSIDNGNLYFACCTYQTEYKKLQTELAELRERCESAEKALEFYCQPGNIISLHGLPITSVAWEYFTKYKGDKK